jgi:hypothetical protein
MGIISTPPRQPNAIASWLADTQAKAQPFLRLVRQTQRTPDVYHSSGSTIQAMGIISTRDQQRSEITPWLADTQARGSLVSCTAQHSQEQYRYCGFTSPTSSQNAFSFTPRYYKVLQLALPLSFYPPNGLAESNLLLVFADTTPTPQGDPRNDSGTGGLRLEATSGCRKGEF